MWHEDLTESDTAPEHLLKDLKDHKKMIYFHDNKSISIPPGKEWPKYSYPLQVSEGGTETYYYVFADNMLEIEVNRISTFDNFKNRNQPDVAYNLAME